MKGHHKFAVLMCAAVALTLATGCKGVDVAALQAKATGLVEKYKPQLETGLNTAKELLAKAEGLPKDLPVVGGLVDKIKGQAGNLDKVKGLLDGLPGQVATAAKDGKGETEITKLLGEVETQAQTGLTEATAALAESNKAVAEAEVEAKKLEVKSGVEKLGESVGAPLAAQVAKLEELLAKAKALPGDNVAAAEIVAGLEVLKGEADKAKATLDGAAKKVEEAGADLIAAQAAVEQTTTEVTAATKTLETELPKFEEKLAALAAAPADFAKALSTGFEVKGAASGIESQLIAFVEDATKVVDKTTWFNFDRLTFQTGSAALDLEASKEQLANMVEILKAFPTVKLKVGGYTDNTGSAEANKKISQQRADAVVAALVEAGIAKERLEAEGYGPEHPVCEANDTEECRAQNRRIAVRVTEK
ncbi:MAG TPA: OmpA family protein [Myxococcota bacterium]|nr:OmpA family protein [Myxococcota bacterium]